MISEYEKKDKKTKETKHKLKKSEFSLIDERFEITAKINDLKILAQNSYISGNYKGAINYAEEIINLAVQRNITSYVKDQEKFINIIADKLQREYIISEIKDVAVGIQQLYETLLKTNNIEKAHEILADFLNRYQDFPEFESIPIVQELITKDKKEWIKYNTIKKDPAEEQLRDDEKDEFDNTLDDIQKFLNTR